MTTDLFFGVVRLAHALAAALWIGGAFVCLLLPGTAGDAPTRTGYWRPVREALRLAIGIFLISGGLMATQRLGSAILPPAYFAVLLVKVALAGWLFSLGRAFGTRPAAGLAWWARPEGRMLLVAGAIYALAMVLRVLYESALKG